MLNVTEIRHANKIMQHLTTDSCPFVQFTISNTRNILKCDCHHIIFFFLTHFFKPRCPPVFRVPRSLQVHDVYPRHPRQNGGQCRLPLQGIRNMLSLDIILKYSLQFHVSKTYVPPMLFVSLNKCLVHKKCDKLR